MIDWTKPIEAVHEDGRVVAVMLKDPSMDCDGDYATVETMRDQGLETNYWTASGHPSPSVSAQPMRWRIRNRQPDPQPIPDRAMALIRRLAGEGDAEAIVVLAEIEPVDLLEFAIERALRNGNDVSAFEIANAIRNDKAAVDAIKGNGHG